MHVGFLNLSYSLSAIPLMKSWFVLVNPWHREDVAVLLPVCCHWGHSSGTEWEMNSCRNPVMALLLLPGGINVEVSVRKRKVPAMFSVLPTCLWERVGRWSLFLPWRMGVSFFFFLSAKPLLRQNYHKLLSHVIFWLHPPFRSGLKNCFLQHCEWCLILRLNDLHGPVKTGNFEDFLQKLHWGTISLVGSEGCASQTEAVRSNHPTWPWWCPVSTVQLNACANICIM